MFRTLASSYRRFGTCGLTSLWENLELTALQDWLVCGTALRRHSFAERRMRLHGLECTARRRRSCKPERMNGEGIRAPCHYHSSSGAGCSQARLPGSSAFRAASPLSLRIVAFEGLIVLVRRGCAGTNVLGCDQAPKSAAALQKRVRWASHDLADGGASAAVPRGWHGDDAEHDLEWLTTCVVRSSWACTVSEGEVAG